MAVPTPFKINILDDELELLKNKLDLARLPKTSPAGWTEQEGVPLNLMEEMLAHWRISYLPRWREREAAVNRLPMYTLPIDAEEFGPLNIHFVWKKSKKERAVPCLFAHGWPGCFLEVTKMLDQLIEGEENGVTFDVVAPSLPNFGFSDGVNKKGFHIGEYGKVLHKLMLSLGYPEYVTQGGDWGSMITRQQSRLFPESVKAVHINFAAMKPSNLLWQPYYLLKFMIWPWSKQEKAALGRAQAYQTDGNAYYKLNSQRPLTAAYMMADSPIAVLGYVWEKIRHWSADSDASWTQDEVLDWISIYWFSTAGPGASVNIYHEAEQGMSEIGGSMWEYIPARLGVTQFPGDICGMPSAALQTLGPVVFERWADKGGHFAAWEVPDELVKDLRSFFGRGGAAFDVVDGKSGYRGL